MNPDFSLKIEFFFKFIMAVSRLGTAFYFNIFILYSLFFILYSLFFILYSLFFILY